MSHEASHAAMVIAQMRELCYVEVYEQPKRGLLGRVLAAPPDEELPDWRQDIDEVLVVVAGPVSGRMAVRWRNRGTFAAAVPRIVSQRIRSFVPEG
jgi:hypothetical protein